MDRDYETPHDLQEHIEKGFKASDLTMGSDLQCRLMIPCPVIRSILQHLTSRCFRGPGSGQVSRQSKDMVEQWMKENRPFLLAFLRSIRCPIIASNNHRPSLHSRTVGEGCRVPESVVCLPKDHDKPGKIACRSQMITTVPTQSHPSTRIVCLKMPLSC
jgi:hypothetical protein